MAITEIHHQFKISSRFPAYPQLGFPPPQSGAFLETRPQCMQMLADADAKLFDIVIFEAGDRLARTSEAMNQIAKRLRIAKIKLHTPKRGEWNKRDVVHVGLFSEEQRERLVELMTEGRVGKVTALREQEGASRIYPRYE
jgi:DNA invertase Pin-like site-specific DNA recombinase